ncbi:RPC3 [Auxenochlorella protothecoides x Auxenochlorella symbiontica]
MAGLHDPCSHPAATRLALKLVEEQFGETCRTVARALLYHGTQSLGDLRRSAGLPLPHLKAALLVLMQHNCVASWLHAEPPNLRGESRVEQLYEALPRAMLHGLHAPRYLIHVKDSLGATAEAVALKLLQHGRLRLDQVVAALQSEDAAAASQGQGEEAQTTPQRPALEIQAALLRLVRSRLVERAPVCHLPPPRREVHPNARKKKPATKPGSEEEAEQLRARAQDQAHAAYHAVRFKIPTDLVETAVPARAPDGASLAHEPARGGLGTSGAQADGSVGGKRTADSMPPACPPPPKRGRRRVKADSGQSAPSATPAASLPASSAAAPPAGHSTPQPLPGVEEAADLPAANILWRVSLEEFNLRLRNEAIADHMGSRHGPAAGAVVAGMLAAHAARLREAGAPAADGERTVLLSEAEVARAVAVHEPDMAGAGPAPDVPGTLSSLAAEWASPVVAAGDPPAGARQYSLDIAGALGALRQGHLEVLLHDRFGPEGLRIWRLLRACRQLEQKQVADFCMMDAKDAKVKLHAMLKAGYIALQDVPRTADRAPSRTFYLWRADVRAACAAFTIELFLAAGNLHARLAHELSQRAELLRVLDLVNAGLAGPGALAERASDFSRIKRVTTLLEAGLLDVGASLALFLGD